MGARGCLNDLDTTGLVVDVGANAGYFAAHALSMGCSVLALEPTSDANALLRLNIALNRPKVLWIYVYISDHCIDVLQHALAQVHAVAVGASHATARATEQGRSWGVTQFQVCCLLVFMCCCTP